jgi:hypothetical protein
VRSAELATLVHCVPQQSHLDMLGLQCQGITTWGGYGIGAFEAPPTMVTGCLGELTIKPQTYLEHVAHLLFKVKRSSVMLASTLSFLFFFRATQERCSSSLALVA